MPSFIKISELLQKSQ